MSAIIIQRILGHFLNNIYPKITIIILFGLLLFFAFNRHSKTGIQEHKSEIWADKAGYYVYLPSCFIYSFNAELFPDSIDLKTGNGFKLDHTTGKVQTKYSYGVALMQMPFFAISHITALSTTNTADGFSLIYHRAIDIAAVFYLMLGLIFLWKYLAGKFNRKIAFISTAMALLGTNLLYYGTIETGMSHIYSFALVAIFLYLFSKPIHVKENIIKFGFLTGVVAGLIIIIRPINILLIIAITLISLINHGDLKKRLFNLKFIIPFLSVVVLLFIPQLVYWKYLSGSWFIDSYKGETFSNWKNPLVLEYLFAPNNGMLLYNPILIICIAGLIFMILKKQKEAVIIGLLFLLTTYLYSSWWIYSFGCGYASRNMVEYLPLLIVPLTYLFVSIKGKILSISLYLGSLVFLSYNIKMILSYGWCWFGKGNWDWNEYVYWLGRSMH